jgi:hypothetical protein
MFPKACIPCRGCYSAPFARWQGALANEHAVVLGAAILTKANNAGMRILEEE